MDKVFEMAQAANVRAAWLFTGEGPMRGEGDLKHALNPNYTALVQVPDNTDFHHGENQPLVSATTDRDLIPATALSDYAFIPRRDVMAAAGDLVLIPGEEVVDYVLFKTEYLRRDLGLDPRNLTVIQAKGDSMEPTIRSGDLLLLDMSQAYEGDNAIYVLNIDGRVLVKRLAFRLDGAIEVKSDNERYASELVKPQGNDLFRIVARVVWKGGRM